MAVIGATQLAPVNVLGSYVQGMELGRAATAQRQQEAEKAQLQNYLASADLSSPEVQNALLRMPGGAQIAQQAAQLSASRAAAERSQYEMARGKLTDLYNVVSAAKDPTSYARARAIAEQMGLDLTQIPEEYDPAFVEQAKNSVLTAAQRLDAELRRGTMDVQRGQLRLAERKLLAEEEAGPERPAPPQGYRYTADDTLEPIPGGPKDPKVAGEFEGARITAREAAKRDAAFPKENAFYTKLTGETDELIKELKALKNMPGLKAAVGPISGRTLTVRGPAADFEAKLKTILARGQFKELQDMRAASPTGGALGNVSNYEIEALQNAFGQLSLLQTDESFIEGVESVIKRLQKTKSNLSTAYDETYGYRENRGEAVGDVMAEADAILGL